MRINKKTIFAIFLMLTTLFLNINKAYAVEKKSAYCYYSNSDKSFRAIVRFYTGEGANGRQINSINGEVTVMNYNGKSVDKIGNVKNINENWKPKWGITYFKYDMTVENIEMMKNNYTNCPKYLATGNWQKNSLITNNQADAQELINDLTLGAEYGSNVSSKDFFGIILCGDKEEECKLGEKYEIHCDSSLFGNPSFAGNDKNPPSLAYLINWALGIMRIIAIAALIVFGTIDMGKAVLAGKEDEMKKAQSTFIKRIIACICVFLVPTFINIIMNFADMAWDGKYESCTLEDVMSGQTYNINNVGRGGR